MSDGSSGPRRYGEKEISRLLERATELQVAEPTAPNPGGMTLAELEEIAAEAGIDGRYLRRAALELESGAADRSFWEAVVGDRLALVYETTIPGELPETGFERVVATIQASAGEHGQPSLLGRTLTWQAETPTKSRLLLVLVSARSGETHVRIEERLHQSAGQLFGGGVGGFGVGAGMGFGIPLGLNILGSALFAAAFPLGAVALSYLGAREIHRATVRRRRRALSELFDRLVAEVTASVGEAALASAGERRALTEG